MGPFELHIEGHRCIEIEPRFLCLGVDLRHVISIVQEIFRSLVDRDILLRPEVVLHGDIAVEMILVEIQKDGYVWREFQIRELMAGEFINDERIFGNVVIVVETGKTDVAAQDRVPGLPDIVKDMVKKRRRRALSFGSGNTDHLRSELFHEKTCLGDVLRFFHMGDDAGAFEDEIVAGCLGKDLLFRTFYHLIDGTRTVLIKEFLGRLSFPAATPDEYTLVIEFLRNLHASFPP